MQVYKLHYTASSLIIVDEKKAIEPEIEVQTFFRTVDYVNDDVKVLILLFSTTQWKIR